MCIAASPNSDASTFLFLGVHRDRRSLNKYARMYACSDYTYQEIAPSLEFLHFDNEGVWEDEIVLDTLSP